MPTRDHCVWHADTEEREVQRATNRSLLDCDRRSRRSSFVCARALCAAARRLAREPRNVAMRNCSFTPLCVPQESGLVPCKPTVMHRWIARSTLEAVEAFDIADELLAVLCAHVLNANVLHQLQRHFLVHPVLVRQSWGLSQACACNSNMFASSTSRLSHHSRR